MLRNKIKSFIAFIFVPLMLVACSDDDAGSASQSQTTAPSTASAPAATESAMSESMEKMEPSEIGMDNGVIYQDEIYKNWPYQ